jgi:hypothetical protein
VVELSVRKVDLEQHFRLLTDFSLRPQLLVNGKCVYHTYPLI